METPEEKYIREHSMPQSEALSWLVKQTHLKTAYARMLTGSVQGSFLTTLLKLMNARKVLEIGTFTGYSSICMAYGLPEDGHVDTLEINDELEYLIREGFEKAGVTNRITLHIGDAFDTLSSLEGETYDLAYIDANKREYSDYYDKIIDMIRPGGCIIVDDVLWDGKPYAEDVPNDKQTQGIVHFNEKVIQDPRVEVVMLPVRHGMSIIRKK